MDAIAERELALERHCVQLTYKQTRIVAITIGVCAIAFWPLDYVFYSDEVIAAFRIWRIAIVVLSIVALLLVRMQDRIGARISWLLIVILAIGSGFCGYGSALAGTIGDPWFHAAYALPLVTSALMVGLAKRIIANFGMSGAFVVAYMVGRPDQLEHPHLFSVLVFTSFALAGCVLVGHVFYRLNRESFYQRVELAARTKQLEAADRLKNELFANVSHEFRTPLMLVMVHLRAMYANDSLHADAALRNCARLLLLVDQLLELARLGTRDQPARMQRLDLAHLASDVGLAFRQDLTIEGADITRPAWGDAQQLRTVVYNLLSNAFKFSDPVERKIRLRVHVDDRLARIEVEDNGIGIAPEKQAEIFERFVQAEQGATRRYGGVGLGLSLVREIARAHGGSVHVESKLGKGSTFVFEWPQALDREASEPVEDEGREKHLEIFALARSQPPLAFSSKVPQPPASLGPTRTSVLIVEDDLELRAYLASVLDRVFHIETAADGNEALEKLRRTPFDLIVSDLMIPGISGLDLVKAVRGDPKIARVPVLIITARSERDVRAQAYRAGADDYLAKPFDDEELLARAFNLIAGRRKERELAASNAELEARVAARTADMRRLSAHLAHVREDERERLARELHDEAGQLLTGLRIDLSMARKAQSNDARNESHERMEHLLDQSFDILRRIVTELRPRLLDEMGLAPAIEWYVEHFGARTGITCELELGVLPRRDPSEIAAFRIVQETLTNVARHSSAKNVQIRLASDGTSLLVTIVDDGVGFDTKQRKRGFGLLGMAERAQQLGGVFEVQSVPGRGTTTRVRLPLAEVETASCLES